MARTMTGTEAAVLRNQRNAAKTAAGNRVQRRATGDGPDGTSLTPPEGMPAIPDSSGVGAESPDLGFPPDGMPTPKQTAAGYDKIRRDMRRAAGLPDEAPVSAPEGLAPAAVPTAEPENADNPEDDKKPKPPVETAGPGATPMPPASPMPPIPPVEATEPPGADPMIPPAGGELPIVPPAAEGQPAPSAIEEEKDQAYAEMMGEEEMEPAEGKPYTLGLFLKNASAKLKAGSEGPFYTVEINGHAVGEIHLSDIPHANVVAQQFLDENSYGASFARAVKSLGFRKAMQRARGRILRARLGKTKLAAQIRAEVTTSLESDHRRRAAKLRDDYVSKMNVSAQALNKGILHDQKVHPLKEALVKVMASELKIHPARALPVIDAAFAEGFLATFDQIAAKAEELLSAPAEFYAAYEKEVRASAPRPTQDIPSVSQPFDRMANLVAGSMPLVARPNPVADDNQEAVANQRAIQAALGGQ